MKLITANEDDVPRMMNCAKLCCEEHGEAALGGALNPVHYEERWRGLIGSGSGAMFLHEDDGGEIVGGVGGVAYKALLTGQLRCGQLFVYVRPEHRGRFFFRRLLHALETWAMRSGCLDITMPLLGTMPEKTAEVYERNGYAPLETVYRKRLEVA